MYPSSFLVLRVVLVAALGGVVLLANHALADDSPFYFDESGRVQQHGYSSPRSSPQPELSQRQPDYDTDRRMQHDQMNREIQRQNEALVEGYYGRKPSPSSGVAPSNDQYLVFPGPDVSPKICQRSWDTVYCQ